MNYRSRRDIRDRPAETADTSVKMCDLTLSSSYIAPTPLLSKEEWRKCRENHPKTRFLAPAESTLGKYVTLFFISFPFYGVFSIFMIVVLNILYLCFY